MVIEVFVGRAESGEDAIPEAGRGQTQRGKHRNFFYII